MQNSLFLGYIKKNLVLSFLIERQQYSLLFKISPSNPRFKVLGNLNLEIGLPCGVLGILSKWYHSSSFSSQASNSLPESTQVQQLPLQRTAAKVSRSCFFSHLASITLNFWARVQQAYGQAELDKQMELVPAYQPGPKMCWSNKCFLNHGEH